MVKLFSLVSILLDKSLDSISIVGIHHDNYSGLNFSGCNLDKSGMRVQALPSRSKIFRCKTAVSRTRLALLLVILSIILLTFRFVQGGACWV